MTRAAMLLLLSLSASSDLAAQDPIPPAEWEADLRFLQRTVHADFPFLFKKTTAEAFDAEVEKLSRAIPSLQEHEIVAGLARIVSSFGYGHTSLGLEGGAVKFHQIPLNLYWFSDGIYVQGAHKDHGAALGAKVIEVEGMPVGKALELIRPLVPAENDQYFKAHGVDFLCIPEALHAQRVTSSLEDSITLKLEKDGKPFERTFAALPGHGVPRRYGLVRQEGDWLDARDPSGTPLYLKDLDRRYAFEHLPERRALYVRQSQIQDEPDEPIPAFWERVFEFVEKNDVERLVLDVRLNGGGNNYKNKPIVTGVIRCEKIDRPGGFFVILGRRTFSACQNLVNELHTYTHAVFVGEPTSENVNFYGDNRRVDLPNSKIPVFLSFAWWQDKPQWEGDEWLAPHVAVEMSFEDYRSNRDPALEAALGFSGEGFVLDPMGHLRDLFEAGKVDDLRAEATRMVKDSRFRYLDFERKLNEAGYDLLNRSQAREAVAVFRLNADLFPTSANTWDSLAEGCWRSNETDKAIEYYEKAIELDPNGATGDNARRMLRRIRGKE